MLDHEQTDGLWWLGHASILLRLQGHYLLTDPVFSHRASPVRFAGPQRRTPPTLDVADIVQLDAILISHNHYDHRINGRCASCCAVFPRCTFVPLGLGHWVRQLGAHHVFELDWWQSVVFKGLSLTAVPARHWSMRTFWGSKSFTLVWMGCCFRLPSILVCRRYGLYARAVTDS